MTVKRVDKPNDRFKELFVNPTCEYRGAPFWAWNTKLDKEQIKRQLPIFKEMGFGGYHVHPRTGLDTAYLSDEFFEMVKLCADYAKENGMKCYGYDEDRFPSGSAGGIVTENICFRQRKLIWTDKFDEKIHLGKPEGRAKEDYYLGKYVIVRDVDGYVTSYKKIDFDEQTDEYVRYALVKIAEPEQWFNNRTYVDTMYKPAMDEFIKVTHEKYYSKLGEYFGEIIPSFFTDEPKVAYKKVLSDPWDEGDIVLPWSDDFPDTYKEKYGIDIVERIPELYFELSENRISKARYFYHRHIMERFCQGFSDNIGKWCDEHGVSLAGHMVKEPKLSSQSVSAGEVMAPLSAFGIPGIDMLCDAREYTTAKQAQSIKEQYGRNKMLSELYGVTNWLFDFRGHKLAGDWQAALGVNLRVPHLAWMSMKGEAKRDYPASIFYQSPWYKEYKTIENHFARVNLAMGNGKRVCRVAMIHPVESCWNYWGVKSQTKEKLKQLDNAFKSITEKLLFSQIDFDYISEALLPTQFGGITDNQAIRVGKAVYDVVILAGCESLRSTTKAILDKWIANGGKVLVLEKTPEIMEGERVYAESDFYGYSLLESEEELIAALSKYRDFCVVNKDGSLSNQFLIQERIEDENHWFFIANGRKDDKEQDVFDVELTVEQKGIPYLFDSMSGEIYQLNDKSDNDKTTVALKLCKHDSALIYISDKAIEGAKCLEEENKEFDEIIEVSDSVPVSLSENNCLILDIAEYYLDGKKADKKGPEEILRIGQTVREELGIVQDSAKMAQPWTKVKKAPEHTISVTYKINSRIDVFGAKLALEDVALSDIYVNGKQLIKEVDSYYVDEAIETIALPPILKGENTIEICIGFGEGTDLEAAYLLGDFTVYKDENGYYLDSPVKELKFGDVTSQGLPFYGGNITYDLYYESEDGAAELTVPSYKGSLINVESDGESVGKIIFDPYKLKIKGIKNGKHVVGLTLYGNRVNTFGPLHNKLKPLKWVGPEAFRTRDLFTYDYELSEFGILEKPVLRFRKEKQDV